MFLEERQDAIASQLAREGKVTVHELSKQYGVTEDCIRKDLGALEKQGRLKRTYGGAVLLRDNLQAQGVSRRRNSDIGAKRRIAKAAHQLLQGLEMVFLDISTSNLALAELLVKEERELTVVTNMIDIMVVLARNPRIRVICTGGAINKSRDGFWGGTTVEFIERLKPDIAFLGAVGIDIPGNAALSYDVEDGTNKAAIIKAAKRCYVVAELKKFGDEGNYKYASLDDLQGIITDSTPDEVTCKAVAELGIELVLPKELRD